MTAKTLRIAEIQTTDLLYYDPDCSDECFNFCQDRDIDCLPSLTDPWKYYQREEATSKFIEKRVDVERMVCGTQNIFEPSMLERFRKSPLLFVYTYGELSGVVHFSDYNKSSVGVYLYELLADFEKALRGLLVKHGLGNEDVLSYFDNQILTADNKKQKDRFKKKTKDFNKDKAKNEKLPPFQNFYLLDLIGLAEYKKIISVDCSINDLRNMVMHAHDLVEMEDANTPDYIYTFTSFEKFFTRVVALHQDYRKVNNRIAFAVNQKSPSPQ